MIPKILSGLISKRTAPTTRPWVSLPEAMLCCECDTIYSSRDGSDCPRCTTESRIAMARFLEPIRDREER